MSMADFAAQPDYTPLTASVTAAELTAFRQQSKANGAPWARRPDPTGRYSGSMTARITRMIPIVVPLVGFLVVLALIGPEIFGLVWAAVSFAGNAEFPLNLVPVGILAVAALILSVLVGALVSFLRGLGYPKGWWEAALRLTRFASANGLVYGHEQPVAFGGSIFGIGENRVAARRLGSASGRLSEVGNYRYVEVTRDSDGHTRRTVRTWGYIAIGLDRKLPHMMLDARANDAGVLGMRRSNLPVAFSRDQVLSLEGDFDRHFTLYAPREYERDALYVFTPDLMALLIDQTGAFDVEIVENTLFIYSSGFDLLAPATYERMRAILSTVGAKTISRTSRYTDDRVGNRMVDEVAPPGKRLKRRRNVVYLVLGVALLLWYIFDEYIAPVSGLPWGN